MSEKKQIKRTPRFETFGVFLSSGQNPDEICREIYQILVNHQLSAKEGKEVCHLVQSAISNHVEQFKLEL